MGLLPTYQFLFDQKPSFEAFEHWVTECGGGTITAEIIAQCNQLLVAKTQTNEYIEQDVLSVDDIDFWNENGYVIIKNAIPQEDCAAARQAIWNHLQMDENNIESWYTNANAVQVQFKALWFRFIEIQQSIKIDMHQKSEKHLNNCGAKTS